MATDNTKQIRIVAYCRTSTARQNLGLDAQLATIREYANSIGAEIIDVVVEQESGADCYRPGIAKAMAMAKRHNAVLCVAKLDRLSRNISFASQVLFDSGIAVRVLDMTEDAQADKLVFAVFAGLAARELDMIKDRTTKALYRKRVEYAVGNMATLIAAANAVGVDAPLPSDGNPDAMPAWEAQTIAAIMAKTGETRAQLKQRLALRTLGRPGAKFDATQRKAANDANKAKADSDPANITAASVLRQYFAQADGKRNLSAAARYLNDRQLYTPRGVFWTAQAVKNLCNRFSI